MVAYCWGQKSLWFYGLDMVHGADMVGNIMSEIYVHVQTVWEKLHPKV